MFAKQEHNYLTPGSDCKSQEPSTADSIKSVSGFCESGDKFKEKVNFND